MPAEENVNLVSWILSRTCLCVTSIVSVGAGRLHPLLRNAVVGEPYPVGASFGLPGVSGALQCQRQAFARAGRPRRIPQGGDPQRQSDQGARRLWSAAGWSTARNVREFQGSTIARRSFYLRNGIFDALPENSHTWA